VNGSSCGYSQTRRVRDLPTNPVIDAFGLKKVAAIITI